MLIGIDIQNFRGIQRGGLDGLTPLTVLTGTNASGKTSVMDAMLIGLSTQAGHAIHQAMMRHANDGGPQAPWLVHSGTNAGTCQLKVWLGTDRYLSRTVEVSQPLSREGEGRIPLYRVSCQQTLADVRSKHVSLAGQVVVYADGETSPESFESGAGEHLEAVRLVDGRYPRSLALAYSDAKRAGRGRELDELLHSLGFEGLDLLTEPGSSKPVLYVDRGDQGAVPLALAGDGIESVVRTAVELARAPGGVVLLEEPEAFQHPATLTQTARLIVAATRRSIQVLVATHSQELIDKLLLANTREQADRVAQFTLSLKDGELSAVRRAGDELYAERWERERDLR